MNKKGAEMTIGTIVIIILALVVLVVLIYGFSTGWSNLWQNVIGFGGGSVNVQTIIQSCQVSCSTSATYDYCTKKRDIVFDKVNGKKNPLDGSLTCNDLKDSKYNAALTCSNIDCGATNGEIGTCSGTPAPLCDNGVNQGKTNCENILGCKFTSTATDPKDTNTGRCEKDTTIACPPYTNVKAMCDRLTGCTWKASP